MFGILKNFLSGGEDIDRVARTRLIADTRPPLIYAVGDVHGCLVELQRLETRIIADAARFDGPKWIIMLGDYVDRGSRSAQVIDHLLSPAPEGFERFCLAGNHEQLMLEFLQDPKGNEDWLRFGGLETLLSYGIKPDELEKNPPGSRQLGHILKSYVPDEHITFLKELPSLISVPGFLFVHAGLRPGVTLEQQSDHDLMWIRDAFSGVPRFFEDIIVHGHTPTEVPEYSDGRVSVDTGAFNSGVLSAARISGDGEVQFIDSI